MRNLRYLQTSKAGLAWMRAYYRKNPQLNIAEAVIALRHAEALIRDPIFSAPAYEESETVRVKRIERTHFSLLYTIAKETVWIIDVRDLRGYRSAEALQNFSRELQQTYGIQLKK